MELYLPIQTMNVHSVAVRLVKLVAYSGQKSYLFWKCHVEKIVGKLVILIRDHFHSENKKLKKEKHV